MLGILSALKSRSLLLGLSGLAIVAYLGYNAYTIHSIKQENQQLNAQIETLQDQKTQLEANINNISSDYNSFVNGVQGFMESQQRLNSSLRENNTLNQERIQSLEHTLTTNAAGNPRDFNAIIQARPTLLENRINNATNAVGRQIEKITSDR